MITPGINQSELSIAKTRTSIKMFIGVLIIFCLLWLLWLFGNGEKSITTMLTSNLNAIVLTSIIVVYLSFSVVQNLKRARMGPLYIRPVNLFLGLYFLYVCWGVATHFITVAIFFDYEPKIAEAVIYSNLGIISFLLSYLFWKKFRGKKLKASLTERDKKFVDWNLRRLRAAIIFVAFFSIAGTCVTFYKLGGIPVFLPGGVGNVNPLLTEVIKGVFVQLHYFNTIVIFLCAIYLMKNHHDVVILLIGVLACLALLGYGGRYGFVLPLVTAFFVFNHYVREIKLRRAIVTFFMIAASLMFYGWWRNRLLEATSFAGAQGDETTIIGAIGNVFTELRDFGLWIKEFQYSGPSYLGVILVVGALMAMFPKQIWALAGIDKDRYLINSAYLTGTAIYHESYTGIRIGFMGELYISFGIFGILAGMGVFGLIFGFLDNKLIASGQKGAQVAIIYYVTFVLTFSLIGHFQGVVASLTYYGFVLYAVYYYATSRQPQLRQEMDT